MDGRLIGALALAALAAGCGGAHTTAPAPTPATSPAAATSTAPAAATTTSTAPAPPALQAEANSAAAGDIPDNQVFLTFRDAAAGYSIKYPEGWAQSGGGASVTFRDKNNVVRILVRPGTAPTAAAVRRQLARARLEGSPQRLSIGGKPALKATYATVSGPNAITGKRVTLVVDRYYVAGAGKEAIVDLGTPRGVDNVDAYRLMIESFRWR